MAGWTSAAAQPQECDQPALPAENLKLTTKSLKLLGQINAEVNAAIEPVSNLEHWGTLADHWDYPLDGKGDCKIYALEKRRQLIERGFPRQALLMTIVKDHHNMGHTILTVRTDKGDFILDNLTDEILSWDETGYRFLKRQSQEDPEYLAGDPLPRSPQDQRALSAWLRPHGRAGRAPCAARLAPAEKLLHVFGLLLLVEIGRPARHHVGREGLRVLAEKSPHSRELIPPADGASELGADVLAREFHVGGKVEEFHGVVDGHDEGVLALQHQIVICDERSRPMVSLDEELRLREDAHIEPRGDLIGVLILVLVAVEPLHDGREARLEALLRLPDESIIVMSAIRDRRRDARACSARAALSSESMTPPGFAAKCLLR